MLRLENETLQEIKYEAIYQALFKYNGNRTEAARHLRVSIRGLRNTITQMKSLHIRVPCPGFKESDMVMETMETFKTVESERCLKCSNQFFFEREFLLTCNICGESKPRGMDERQG